MTGAHRGTTRRLHRARRRVLKSARRRLVKPLRRGYRRSGAAARLRPLRRRTTRAARRLAQRSLSPIRVRADLARCARRSDLAPHERRLARAVSPRMTGRDTRHDSWMGYYDAGLSGLRCVQQSLVAAGAGPPRTLLDLPCGEGRVLRWLAVEYPGAASTACDLSRPGVDHCSAVFGSTPAYSRTDFDALELGSRYDLAWCGSLATHLDGEPVAALLRFFARHLAPGGVLVITTHGAYAAQRMREGDGDYLLPAARLEKLLADHRTNGFAYTDYEGEQGYGVSLSSPGWFRDRAQRVGLRTVLFRERGWADHQDLFALTPEPEPHSHR